MEGKTASRMNALRTGIDAKSQVIRGENPAALDSLAAEYHARFQPSAPEERFLVDTLIDSEWLLRRMRVVEAQLWDKDFAFVDNLEESEKKIALGLTFVREQETFLHLQRRIDSANRAYHRALRALERLQPPDRAKPAARSRNQTNPPAPTLPVRTPPKFHAEKSSPHPIGFVPPNSTQTPAKTDEDARRPWGGRPRPRTDAPVGPPAVRPARGSAADLGVRPTRARFRRSEASPAPGPASAACPRLAPNPQPPAAPAPRAQRATPGYPEYLEAIR